MRIRDIITEITSIKDLANVTATDRAMARRMDQAEAHAKQYRTDLLGQCPIYDDTWHYTRASSTS